MPTPGLDGMSLAGSWCISGEVTLPICSPLYEGHVGLVKLEISSGISLKLHLESKLQLPCYGIRASGRTLSYISNKKYKRRHTLSHG